MGRVKETSDELNPLASVGGTALIAKRASSLTTKDYLALALSTWGVGFIPLAPGTFGSIVGVGLYLLAERVGAQAFALGARHGWSAEVLASSRTAFMLLFIAALTLSGIWAATRAEKLLGRKDPGVVVVDEVAGQLIAFLFVPANSPWWVIITGFVAFRLFDIWKPYPIRRLESLASGLGIMADDVLAGIYAAITLVLALALTGYVKMIF
jgi:phosphatidylglycerophosphatase A